MNTEYVAWVVPLKGLARLWTKVFSARLVTVAR
jgi:hypothetical protein